MDETNTQQRRIVKSFDVDIDFADRDQALQHFVHIPASMYRENKLAKHTTGVYFTRIPLDPVLGAAAIDYKTAENRGYFKVDCLNVSVYRLISDQAHYDLMLEKTPPWHRLWQEPDWTRKLLHIGSYYALLKSMRPDGVEKLAAILAIIRPGKAYLQHQPWDRVFESVWDKSDVNNTGYQFKRSHAFAYAHLVMLHMNLLDELAPESREPF